MNAGLPACWLNNLREKWSLSPPAFPSKEIGEMFDIDYVTVSSTAIRFQKEIEKDKEIRKMRDKVIEVQNAKT